MGLSKYYAWPKASEMEPNQAVNPARHPESSQTLRIQWFQSLKAPKPWESNGFVPKSNQNLENFQKTQKTKDFQEMSCPPPSVSSKSLFFFLFFRILETIPSNSALITTSKTDVQIKEYYFLEKDKKLEDTSENLKQSYTNDEFTEEEFLQIKIDFER